MHFGQRHFFASNVTQPEGNADDIETCVGEGQGFGIHLHVPDACASAIVQPSPAFHDHVDVQIGEQDHTCRADALREARGQVARAAGDVEHMVARARTRKFDRQMFHRPMHARRHQVVHQVVVACNRGEHSVDAAGFFGRRDLLKAKVDLFIGARAGLLAHESGCH